MLFMKSFSHMNKRRSSLFLITANFSVCYHWLSLTRLLSVKDRLHLLIIAQSP